MSTTNIHSSNAVGLNDAKSKLFRDTKPLNKVVIKERKLAKKDLAPALNTFVLTNYVLSDIKKKPRSYRIGVFTVTLTITFVILLYWVLDSLPIVFLKLAQDQSGESDFIYTSQSDSNITYSGDSFMYNQKAYNERISLDRFTLPFVNATKLIELTEDSDDFEGFTPRWFGVAEFSNVTNSNLSTSGIVMVLDTDREVRIGLGRAFTKTLLGKRQVFMTSSTLRYLDIEPNGRDEVQLVVDIRKYLSLFLDTNQNLTRDDVDLIFETLNININTSDSVSISGADLFNTTQIGDDVGVDLSVVDDLEISFTYEQIIDFVLQNQEALLVLKINLTVIESYDAPLGKFANSYGNVMVIDSAFIIDTIVQSFMDNFNNVNNGELFALLIDYSLGGVENVTNIPVNDYAFEVDAVLKDREYYYLGTPQQTYEALLKVQNRLNLRMTLDSSMPVAIALEGFYYLGLFLQSTFATIVFFMILLSIMLIYSLMISDVDEKTYEMGMLRALGLRTVSLVQLIIIQSAIFSIPGVILAFIIGSLLNVYTRYFTFTYSVSYTTYLIAPISGILGVTLGLTMPLASNIWAIKRALGKNIRDSLDIFHTGVSDVLIKIIKLENFGFSPFELVLGLTLVIMGVMTYYLAPAAFLYDRVDIFFFILNIILVGMIVGLAFLWFLIFPTIQSMIIYAIWHTLRFDLKLMPLIMKNMKHSHKPRNAKTSMLFTIALAYLVFGGSSLLLIGNLIVGTVKNFLGADIFITSFASDDNLPESALKEFIMNDMTKSSSGISDYAFQGIDFTEYSETVLGESYKTYAISGGYFPDNKVYLYPVEQRYLHAALTEFFIPKYGQSSANFPKVDGKDDYVWSLYTDYGTNDFDGDLDKYDVESRNLTDVTDIMSDYPDPTREIKILLPEGIKDVLSITGGDTIKLGLFTGSDDEIYVQSYRLLIRGLPQKMPGFFFMSYKQVQFFLQGLISFEQAEEMALLLAQDNPDVAEKLDAYKADIITGEYSYSYPKETLLIDVKKNFGSEDREVLVNQLGGLLPDDLMVILDVIKFEETVQSSLSMLQIFIIIVGTVAFTISFFLLVVSTTANIRENLWEFGVLRAIGLQKSQIIRVYLYESLAVTITACILGLLVGFIIAFTLSIQFNLFLELPFFIAFPYTLVSVMLVLAIMTTIIGTVVPLYELNKRPIAGILKAAG